MNIIDSGIYSQPKFKEKEIFQFLILKLSYVLLQKKKTNKQIKLKYHFDRTLNSIPCSSYNFN